MLNSIQQGMVAAGYCVSPNNIYSLPGVGMYPAGPLVPEPPRGMDIQVDETIKVYRVNGFKGCPGDKGEWIMQIVQEFTAAADFIRWCKENGQLSEGGQPPNVWD